MCGIPTLTYNRANIVNIKDAIKPTLTHNRANIVNIKDAIIPTLTFNRANIVNIKYVCQYIDARW
jgi:hypothetical protein